MNKKVSFIVPTYNEGENILQSIKKLLSWVEKYNYEIIIVDDSTDDTFNLINRYIKQNEIANLKIIQGARNGKGAAVKVGILESTGDIVFYLDADMLIPLVQIDVFISEIINNNYDIVIGKRLLNRKGRSPLRYILSICLFLLQRILIFNSTFFYDTQCGFKAFKKEAVMQLVRRQQINGGMFDIELLYMALVLKMRINQIEVSPEPENRVSRISLFKCFYDAPIDLLRIKINNFLLKYKD
ncbi:MAG: glycosyltransferase [Candidatus Melainabacteria bacterium]|nr:glycosyltransferase [Candidatus Melainabacteria bacterium]